MTADPRPAPKPTNLWILQGAFLVGHVTYGGVGLIAFGGRDAATSGTSPLGGAGLPGTGLPGDGGPGDMIGTILLAIAVLIIATAFALPRFVAGLDPDRAPNADGYIDNAFKQLVVTNALLEAPALFALLSVLLGKPISWALVVIALSAGGMILMIPKIRGWIDEYGRRVVRER
jgi:hypothetical protein